LRKAKVGDVGPEIKLHSRKREIDRDQPGDGNPEDSCGEDLPTAPYPVERVDGMSVSGIGGWRFYAKHNKVDRDQHDKSKEAENL
tara:strand:- start:1301 stop:1555 length:255 start_codon:yes stop_codon:yes gene_type:complete